MNLKTKGILFVISSPSGGGKTTIVNNIIKKHNSITKSVSTTTRKKRIGEKNGCDYFFVSKEDFLKQKDNMLEYAKVFENYYGTSKIEVERSISQNIDVICTIDVQGAKIISEKIKNIKIFILPPSIDELAIRLLKRGKDSEEQIKKRLDMAKKEISESYKYDYIVINSSIQKTINQITNIIKSERLKTSRQNLLPDFIKKL